MSFSVKVVDSFLSRVTALLPDQVDLGTLREIN